MPWFLGLLLVVVCCLVTSCIVGRGIIGVIGIRLVASRSAEALAVAPTLGAALWALTFGALSHAGAPARPIALVLVLLSVSVAAAAALRRGLRFLVPDRRDRACTLLGALGIGAAIIAMLPIALGNAYLAANDTFTYVVLSDYLQHHGWSHRVTVDPYQPALAQVFLHQRIGLSVGAVFLLALVQASLPGLTAIDLYPAVAAWSLSLNVLSFFAFARWGLRLRRSFALLGAFVVAIAPNPLQSASATGHLRQQFGTAVFVLLLALLIRVFRRQRRRWTSAVALGIGFAFLITVYSELFSVAILVTAVALIPAVWRALRSRRLVALLHNVAVVGLTFGILANVEIARAVRVIPMLTSIVVGHHVRWSVVEFVAFAMGVRPGSSTEGALVGPLAVVGLTGFTGALCLMGCWGILRWKRECHVFAAAIAVFVGMAVYFSLVATNPWTGRHGHTWDLYKVAQWSFPVVLAAQVAGLQMLSKRTNPRAVAAIAAATVTIWALPLDVSLARMRASVMHLYARSDQPFVAFRQLADAVDRFKPETIYLLSPHGQVWPRLLYTYFLFPRPIASDWSKTAYMDGVLPRGERFLRPPPRGKTLYLALGAPPNARQVLPGGVYVAPDP